MAAQETLSILGSMDCSTTPETSARRQCRQPDGTRCVTNFTRTTIRKPNRWPASTMPHIGRHGRGAMMILLTGTLCRAMGDLSGPARRPGRLLLRHVRSRGCHWQRHAPAARFVPLYRPSARWRLSVSELLRAPRPV